MPNGVDTTELIENMKYINKFRSDLEELNKTWSQLTLLGQLGNTTTDMSRTQNSFNELTKELIAQLSSKTIKKTVNEMTSIAQVTVDIVIRNLFERTADIGFLSTDGEIISFLKNNSYDINAYQLLKLRFKEYTAKYSVYDDIILFDKEGKIVCRLSQDTCEYSNDEIVSMCKTTKDNFIETFKYHDFIPNKQNSLVYSYKVEDEDKSILGYLALSFKFENEMEMIFRNLSKPNSKAVIMLLDIDGKVIASSDSYHIPNGVYFNTDTNSEFKIISFAGRDYIAKTCKTNGYEGFYGLGWLGHIMIPLDSAFKSSSKEIQINKDILSIIMQNEYLFEKKLLAISDKADKIQEELNRTVWNGNINLSSTNTNNQASSFARSILKEIRFTGEKTKILFEQSIQNLNFTIIEALLDDVGFLATLSIYIMDRNLYERANDCRWWALNPRLKKALTYNENIEDLTDILEYINSLYTVYSNILVYDKNKTILAVSNKDNSLVGTKLSQEWADKTLSIKETSKYCVSDFEQSYLYDNSYSYIYNASILHDENDTVVGGIAIVFDSTTQFQAMLKDSLPKDIQDSQMFAMFVEKKNQKIISSTNSAFKIGSKLNIDNDFFELKNNQSMSKIVKIGDVYYIVGCCCSNGYREYKSKDDSYQNDILSFVFIYGGNSGQSILQSFNTNNQHYNYNDGESDYIDIATFYIGNKWIGVDTKDVVESIDIDSLQTPITMDSNHHFKGTILYKENIVSVLDITHFIKNSMFMKDTKDIIIIRYKNSSYDHTIGILADKLGEIISVPKSKISKLDDHLIGAGMLSQSIVIPPKDIKEEQLLTILNIEKISKL
ncbi:chemotaxis protein CheW [Arcobacter sp. FWKO B]|uniref:chemotaxis protein CheW n=1 Tax=Arcobacter sp. FWKO B TaxID=2593672 RepID=UPI0018A4E07A|nr:chemotaxis protein CheW [Arcobacter sp. FWKO B]QOG11253.1 chemotaxis protein CheW [Arcobacter sp. FWKO B]